MAETDDPISRAAHISAPHGRAWMIAPFALNMVAQWLVEAPETNAPGHSWLIALLELGLYHPAKVIAAAPEDQDTHQIVLYALDPRYPREAISAQGAIHGLGPAIWRSEFAQSEAGEALERVHLAVRAICAGLLDPSVTSGPLGWAALFGANDINRSD